MAVGPPDEPVSSIALAHDTTPDMARRQIETWRRMSPLEKCRLVTGATRAAERLAMVGVRERYPAASERERQLRLAELKLGPSLVRVVYPDAAGLLDPPL